MLLAARMRTVTPGTASGGVRSRWPLACMQNLHLPPGHAPGLQGPRCAVAQMSSPPPLHTHTHQCLHPCNARCALQVLRHEGITPVGKLKALLESRSEVFVVRSIGAWRLALSECDVCVRPTCRWQPSCCAVHPFSGVCICVACVNN